MIDGRKMRKAVCQAGILLFTAGIAGAQTLSEREHIIDSILHPEISEKAALSMQFDESVIGTGIIAEEAAPQSFSFSWTNVGSAPVTVLNVTTSCGCLVPSFDRTHPKGHPGPFDRRIFVYTDVSGKRPAAILSLKGDVQPAKVPVWNYRYRMGDLLLKRREVRFEPGRLAVERILCQNAGEKPLTVGVEKDLLPPYVTVWCEPETIAPGDKADILVRYDPEASSSRMLNVVPVILTGLSLPPTQRTIKVVFSSERPEIRTVMP